MTTAVSKLVLLGPLMLTCGVRDFVDTGVLPYADEPDPNCLGADNRRLWLAACVAAHANGDWGDTCPEDSAMNEDVYHPPGCGGRLMSVWNKSPYPKIWIITDDFGGDSTHTTVLFPSEY